MVRAILRRCCWERMLLALGRGEHHKHKEGRMLLMNRPSLSLHMHERRRDQVNISTWYVPVWQTSKGI